MSSPPTALQLDALREVANIGCGHAASALSQLVGGQSVRIDVPQVSITAADQMAKLVGGPTARVVAVSLEMKGELRGRLLLVLPEKDAHALSSLMLRKPSEKRLSDLERSAIAEAGNIVASACLSAIGKLAGLRLTPSAPHLIHELARSAMDKALDGADCEAGLVLLLQARFFTASGPQVEGQLLVLPERKSLPTLLGKLGV